MRKTLFLFTAMAMANHAFADGVSDGLGMAGDTFYSYTPYIQTLGFVLTCIIGIVGAFAIYYAIVNDERNVKKRILAWGGSCIAMLCMTIALPKLFNYQETGLLADGSGAMAGSTGQFAGGDRWGRIDVSIPGLDDPVWMPDNRFSPIGSFYPINRLGWGTAVVVTPN